MKAKIQHFVDLILVLTQKDLTVRYKSNVLGYLWSIANPLAFAFVYYFAFQVVMRIQMEAYALFLIVGLFPWQWFANSMSVSPTIFLANAGIIKKVNFPRNILIFSLVLQDMLHYIFALPVIFLFLFLYHKPLHFSLLWGIPILLLVQFLFIYGISLFVSSLNLFFRDLERIISIFIMFFFYFTPILYPLEMVPEKYHIWVNLNPLAPMILGWRNLFLYGTIDWISVSISAGYAVLAFGVGWAVYRKLSWKFAEAI